MSYLLFFYVLLIRIMVAILLLATIVKVIFLRHDKSFLVSIFFSLLPIFVAITIIVMISFLFSLRIF